MSEVEKHISQTSFAWVGKMEPGSVFYYRIQSPVILIEFDHQTPANLRHLATSQGPNYEHIHAIVRTPNGNDYGKDLLKQHYAQHKHSAQPTACRGSSPHRGRTRARRIVEDVDVVLRIETRGIGGSGTLGGSGRDVSKRRELA